MSLFSFFKKAAIWSGAIFFLALAALLACLHNTEAPDLLGTTSFSKIALARNGEILKIGLSADQKYRLRVKLEEIPPFLTAALLSYEDRFYYWHVGINPVSLGRAALSLFEGRKIGGSTITMQVARLRYNLDTTTFSGKLKQIWLALTLERHLSKDEILEAYFNLAPYGGNIEGIEAASRIYFDKPASALTISESLALCVIPQNPVSRNPVSGNEFNSARARLAMSIGEKEAGIIPLKIRSPSRLPFLAPHLSMEMLASRPEEKIELAIDARLQKKVEKTIKSYASRHARYGVNNASVIMVHYPTMEIRAEAGSADFFNGQIQGQINGANIRRSPGSTLKPFIFALALEQGLIHPMTMLPDAPKSYAGYDPENFDRGFRGPIPAHQALKESRNLPAIHLASKLAEPDLYEFLRQAGVKLAKPPEYYGLALVLGGAEITMRELAGLYGILTNGGVYKPARHLRKNNDVAQKRLISPETAWLAMRMLVRGDRDKSVYKTGTSNGLRDAWTAGVCGEYIIIVWIGNFNNEANPLFVGAKIALPLFEELSFLAQNNEKGIWDKPPAELNLEEEKFCAFTGDFYKGQCEVTENFWHIPGRSPIKEEGILREIAIDPTSGLRTCKKGGKLKKVWREFWPWDYLEIFARAGIKKEAPPEWEPDCREKFIAGSSIRILLPKKNVVYQKKYNEKALVLPLQAAADPQVREIFWHVDGEYAGSAKPGEIIQYNAAKSGNIAITVVDDLGGSQTQDCWIGVLQ